MENQDDCIMETTDEAPNYATLTPVEGTPYMEVPFNNGGRASDDVTSSKANKQMRSKQEPKRGLDYST